MTSMQATATQQEPRHKGAKRAKWALALLLLFALAWISIIAARYLQTGKPISEISGPLVPAPVARLLYEQPRFTAGVNSIAAPIGVAIAPDGTYYVTESEGERMVRAFDKNNQLLGTFTSAGHSPTYVAVSPKGEVFVTDRSTNSIDIFSRTGEPLGQVPPPVAGEDWHPMGLVFDTNGSLYVTDVTEGKHRVAVLDPEYKLVVEFGNEGQGAGQFYYPNGIAVDARGRIWVADSNNGRVVAFDSMGKALASIGRGTSKGDLGLPRGIAVDNARQWLYVVDTTGHDVSIYDISAAAPKFVSLLAGENQPPGGFAFPNGIAFDGKGKLLVTDRVNNRVQEWTY